MLAKQIQFAVRNLFRNRLRTSINLLIIGICSTVILLIGGFYDYLFSDTEINLIISEGHISITSEDSFIKDFENIDKKLSEDERIFIVFPKLWLNGLAGYEEKSAIFAGEATFFERENIINEKFGHPKREEIDTVDVGNILAKNLGIKESEIINLLIDFNGISFEVANIVSTASRELDRHYIKMPLNLVFEKLNTDKIDSLHIIVKDEKDVPVIQNWISTWLSQNGYNYRVRNYKDSDSYYQSVIEIYLNNFYFVLIAILITNFFAVSNTLSMSIMERVKELGVLRSFGTQKKYIITMFIYEGFFIGFLGFIIGLAFSLLVIFIIKMIGGIYIPPPPTTETGFYAFINISFISILIAFLSATLVSVLSSFISTFRVLSMNIIDKIRYI